MGAHTLFLLVTLAAGVGAIRWLMWRLLPVLIVATLFAPVYVRHGLRLAAGLAGVLAVVASIAYWLGVMPLAWTMGVLAALLWYAVICVRIIIARLTR